MGAVAVRNLDDLTRERLKAQVRLHGRSMESEARAILTAAVMPDETGPEALGSRIAALFADIDGDGLDVTRSIQPARAAVFDA